MKIQGQNIGTKKDKTFIGIVLGLLLCLFITSIVGKYKKLSNSDSKSQETNATQPINYKGNTFEISVNKDGFDKLSQKRAEALKKGLLFSSKDDLVDADIRIGKEEYACKIRLKGDLLDHLTGDRWSFRVMLKNNKEWNGMNTFSIHNSKARAHTAEWLMHELFKREKIIVPDYDFIKAKLNGVTLGVYAYEHHFENQMLKRNQREIGPILKHNDDAYWDNVQSKLTPFRWIEASHIEIFNKNSLDNPDFKKSADHAIGMLNDFLNENKSVEEIFDVSLMAKYFALLDLSHAWHAQQFTNIRFYLNPTTGKLEPIAYDCFGDHLPNVTPGWEAFGEGFNSRISKSDVYERSNVYRYLLFQSDLFFEKYMSSLDKFTSVEYLNKFKNEITAQLEGRVNFINQDEEYKEVKSGFDKLFAKAKFTQNKIPARQNLSLKAYRVNDAKEEIAIQSFHFFPIKILGFGDEVNMTNALEDPAIIESYNPKIPVQTYILKSSSAIKYIYFNVLGVDKMYKVKLSKNSLPLENIPVVKPDLTSVLNLPFISKFENRITIDAGKHTIEKPIVIPSDFELVISPGTIIEFKNNGNLCSYSPIIAMGTKQNPITFLSTEGLNSGVLISDSKITSRFTNCNFIGLQAYKNLNIATKGAFVVYNSELQMSDCSFRDTKASETISIKNSVAKIDDVQINNSKGTALKSSFSSVQLNNVSIIDCGKNGISFQSGKLNSSNIVIKSSLNKALNYTDNVDVYMFKTALHDCYQSLYVNDHSKVTMVNFWNENIEKGIEVRSASEPHPVVKIDQYNDKNVKQKFLLKQGVSIKVNGKKEKG